MQSNTPPTRLVRAIRIFEALAPALNKRQLFVRRTDGAYPVYVSATFHISMIVDRFSTSMNIWPFPNGNGLSKYPVGENKVMNLHRLRDGTYELVSFRRGDWEKDLLRYVGAPLGLLTIHAVVTPQPVIKGGHLVDHEN